ncbi:membrane protein [Nesterenkonia cremea]|uniref:Membrane protein n=2 Tax=Nesterenkonia cremea TaxID=1882340 RepID=A0A917AQN6_9MICC|nr:membrane protein [Nesterenkonia cremea]
MHMLDSEKRRDDRPLATERTIPHSPPEDVLGVLTGTFLAALGLYLLQEAEAVTGGTAGLALLLTYATPLSFGWLFVLVNLPFFLLALWKKGWRFTLKTLVSVSIVSVFSEMNEFLLPIPDINPIYGIVAGNLLLGVALLIVFRHGSSLGGFNVLALIAQEQFHLRAGYVQMSLDLVVILLALTVMAPSGVVLSAAGAVVLNIVLAFNHRPGRYRA